MDLLHNFFNHLSPISNQTWLDIGDLFIEKSYNKSDYFSKEGVVASKFGIVTKGILRGFYRANNGAEYNKTFFTAPSLIGAYSSLITKEVNLINQQCLTDCIIYEADYNSFEKLCILNIELERLSRNIAENHFVIKEKREIDLVMLDASARYEILQSEIPNIDNLIAQYHIASYLGITPTQLSRIRNKLAKSIHM